MMKTTSSTMHILLLIYYIFDFQKMFNDVSVSNDENRTINFIKIKKLRL